MTKDTPNWFAAACGLAYILCFLFLPVYKCFLKLSGVTLLGIAPALLALLLCGLAMVVGGLLLDKRISIGIGGVSALLTMIYGVLGNSVLPLRYIDQLTGSALGQYVPVSMEIGLLRCIVLSIAHCVLEALLGDARRARKPIQAELWDESSNDFGSIDF